MSQMSRKTARRCLFELLFEREFRGEESPEQVYTAALEDRDIPDDGYIRDGFFGICEHSSELDALISRYARGWRADRLSRVSRTVIRLSVYEILYTDVPANVSVSEAVEIAKRYGEDNCRAFVNGVLSSIVKDVNAVGRQSFIASLGSEQSSDGCETSDDVCNEDGACGSDECDTKGDA